MRAEPLIAARYAWWQWRKHPRTRCLRDVERFDWRTIRISLRRPADHSDESD
jgi:hypothetical protein